MFLKRMSNILQILKDNTKFFNKFGIAALKLFEHYFY